MLNVFVSMGKQMPKNKSIVEDAESVAKILAKYGCTMVQSGAKLGLMGVAVQEFEKYSNEMVMITPEQFKTDLDEHICKQNFVVELESDRMKTAIKNFDLAVILPGGMGTFAELAYFNEACKSGESDAKLVILNSKGYYNSLLKFFKHQAKSGFIDNDSVKLQVAKNVGSFEHILQNLIAEKHNQIYQEELQNAKTIKLAEENIEQDENAKISVVTKKSTKKPANKTVKKSEKKNANQEKIENSKVKSVKSNAKSTQNTKVEKGSKGRPAKKVEASKEENVKPEEVVAVKQVAETVKKASSKKSSKTKTGGTKKSSTKTVAKAETVKPAKKVSAKSVTSKASSKAKATSKTKKSTK